jgi:hypothetical protein
LLVVQDLEHQRLQRQSQHTDQQPQSH